MVYDEKSIYKWMMTGGTPIFGNLRKDDVSSRFSRFPIVGSLSGLLAEYEIPPRIA